jgi:hypothetical protein
VKILFLDIDGVLNSASFFKRRKEEAEWDAQVERFQTADPKNINFWAHEMIDPEPHDLLSDFVMSRDVHIVISSSWREVHPLHRIRDIFTQAGDIPGLSHVALRIIDRTDIGSPRQDVILSWVSRFSDEIEAWAVLDDMKLAGLEDVHVKTSWADGLQRVHIEKLKELL